MTGSDQKQTEEAVPEEGPGLPEIETAEDDESGPSRRCIATGRVRPAEEMIRFVVGPDGTVVPDIEGSLPGRGLWISPERDMIAVAQAKRLFAKAARARVTVPEDLAERVERLLSRRCLQIVGLARRAGQVVTGFEKVKAELAARRVALLLEAADAAEGGRAKLSGVGRGVPVIDLFTRDELAVALGRDNPVHVAFAPGRLAQRLAVECRRLQGFRQSGRPLG
ncbi:RNA-binding protein [Telmatospirillum sp. J64-1]|uniref:RNA-binding protein n=1 Tax=Telmatospirillum sp. J64-1 TaxID=2502183 RepID=UPI00115C4883|nr:RNA-binding protein [Telmatospirillum sp. J64-1]